MTSVTVGLIPAPGIPKTLVEKIIEDLPEIARKYVDDNCTFTFEIEVSPLTSSSEYINDTLHRMDKIKEKNEWDYVIGIIDLPSLSENKVVVSEFDSQKSVSLLSLPALGFFILKRKLKRMVIHHLEYMHEYDWDFLISITDLPLFYKDKAVIIDIDNSDDVAMISIPAFGWRPLKKRIKTAIINTLRIINKSNNNDTDIEEEYRELKSMFTLSKLELSEDFFEDSKTEHLLFHMKSKIGGTFRLVSGMTFANNPYNMMQSLSGVTSIAFATGAFGIIFSTMWNLSYLFPTWRLVAISVLSIFGMLFWIIISHDLWEQFTEGESKKLISLYNSTTLLTLFISLLFYYLLLYLLFLAAGVILLPPDFIAKSIQAEHIGVRFYLELAWFAASLTTVAGAIGAGFQDKQVIQESTYGYRQRLRYQENEEENEES